MRPKLYLGEEKETGKKKTKSSVFNLCVEKFIREIIEFFNFGFACALKMLRLELQKL